MKAEVVCEVGASHGEGPLWSPTDSCLYWVDIGAGALHRFDPRSGRSSSRDVGMPIGAVAERAGGGFVLAVETGFASLDSWDAAPEVRAVVDHGPDLTRMNDGACDPHGRFWAGSMAYACVAGAGTLWRLDADWTAHAVVPGLTISNGLDWSDDGRTMWFIDTLGGGSFWDVLQGSVRPGVDAFDMDASTGALSNRRRAFDVPMTMLDGQMTIPDGMTVDADGGIWVAVAGAGEVRRYASDGSVQQVVEVPVAAPTSVAFGGDDLGDLYITSMTPHGEPGEDPRRPTPMWSPRPLEGAVFRCRPGVRGRPAWRFGG
jgi:sugar lactone lactonase YvrE